LDVTEREDPKGFQDPWGLVFPERTDASVPEQAEVSSALSNDVQRTFEVRCTRRQGPKPSTATALAQRRASDVMEGGVALGW
jgi:hypothetical protein